MKTLTQLTAAQALESAAPWREPRGIVAAVHHEIERGRFVRVALGSRGLLICHSETVIGIPLEAVLELAGQHEPAFATRLPQDSTLRTPHSALE